MRKYIIIYYIEDTDLRGIHMTNMRLNYVLDSIHRIRRAELKLRKALEVEKLTIISYKEIGGK